MFSPEVPVHLILLTHKSSVRNGWGCLSRALNHILGVQQWRNYCLHTFCSFWHSHFPPNVDVRAGHYVLMSALPTLGGGGLPTLSPYVGVPAHSAPQGCMPCLVLCSPPTDFHEPYPHPHSTLSSSSNVKIQVNNKTRVAKVQISQIDVVLLPPVSHFWSSQELTSPAPPYHSGGTLRCQKSDFPINHFWCHF